MEDKQWKIFQSICGLVSALKDTFPKDLSICLYDRFLNKLTESDTDKVDFQINIFNEFLTKHSQIVLEKGKFPEGEKITFKPTIYVDIARYLDELDGVDKEAIYSHLLTIYALIDPSELALAKLEDCPLDIDKSTNEGQFLANIFDNVKTMIPPKEDIQNQNPMAAISGIMQLFPQIMAGIQSESQAGNLDPKKMLNAMHGMLGSMLKDA
jgi:hypothetical protein